MKFMNYNIRKNENINLYCNLLLVYLPNWSNRGGMRVDVHIGYATQHTWLSTNGRLRFYFSNH